MPAHLAELHHALGRLSFHHLGHSPFNLAVKPGVVLVTGELCTAVRSAT